MKAEELMIGDWVIFKAETPKMCKVVSIDTDNGNYIRQSLTDTYYTEDCFEPIPLTAEILIKNGISLSYDKNIYGSHFKEDKDYRLEISQEKRDGIFWSINGDEYHVLKLNYIHELQHALKLCGIEKEIVI